VTADTRLAHDWFDRPLPANVRIGERAWLYSAFAFLHFRSQLPDAVEIGDDSGIYDSCHFELGPVGRVTIGRFCAVVGAIINTNRHVRIDDYAFVAHEVVIADEPFAVPPGRQPGDARAAGNAVEGVHIGENAWIGARAILLGNARIGEGAVVGAAAVITSDVPPFAIAAGNPARIVGWTRPGEAA